VATVALVWIEVRATLEAVMDFERRR
jgi:hypothetical protein